MNDARAVHDETDAECETNSCKECFVGHSHGFSVRQLIEHFVGRGAVHRQNLHGQHEESDQNGNERGAEEHVDGNDGRFQLGKAAVAAGRDSEVIDLGPAQHNDREDDAVQQRGQLGEDCVEWLGLFNFTHGQQEQVEDAVWRRALECGV